MDHSSTGARQHSRGTYRGSAVIRPGRQRRQPLQCSRHMVAPHPPAAAAARHQPLQLPPLPRPLHLLEQVVAPRGGWRLLLLLLLLLLLPLLLL